MAPNVYEEAPRIGGLRLFLSSGFCMTFLPVLSCDHTLQHRNTARPIPFRSLSRTTNLAPAACVQSETKTRKKLQCRIGYPPSSPGLRAVEGNKLPSDVRDLRVRISLATQQARFLTNIPSGGRWCGTERVSSSSSCRSPAALSQLSCYLLRNHTGHSVQRQSPREGVQSAVESQFMHTAEAREAHTRLQLILFSMCVASMSIQLVGNHQEATQPELCKSD